MSLDQQTCVPCRGGVSPLTREEAAKFLAETPGWTLNDAATCIERSFKFQDFRQAMQFVNKVGDLAEQQGHHPDVTFGWGYAKVVLFTHKIRGLHQNDFIVASKIDRLAA